MDFIYIWVVEFNDAKLLTSTIHYIIGILFTVFGVFYKYNGFKSSCIRFYLIFVLWAVICYLADGCPLTYLENNLALTWFGEPFYPEYSFEDSNVYALLSYKPFYYPIILLTILYTIQYYAKEKA